MIRATVLHADCGLSQLATVNSAALESQVDRSAVPDRTRTAVSCPFIGPVP